METQFLFEARYVSYCPLARYLTKRNLEEGCVLDVGFGGYSPSWYICLLAAVGSGCGHKSLFTSECWHTAAFLLFQFRTPAHEKVLLCSGCVFLPQLNLPGSILKDTQACVSWVIPNLVTLTVKINYHTRQVSETELYCGADDGLHPDSVCFQSLETHIQSSALLPHHFCPGF